MTLFITFKYYHFVISVTHNKFIILRISVKYINIEDSCFVLERAY